MVDSLKRARFSYFRLALMSAASHAMYFFQWETLRDNAFSFVVFASLGFVANCVLLIVIKKKRCTALLRPLGTRMGIYKHLYKKLNWKRRVSIWRINVLYVFLLYWECNSIRARHSETITKADISKDGGEKVSKPNATNSPWAL